MNKFFLDYSLSSTIHSFITSFIQSFTHLSIHFSSSVHSSNRSFTHSKYSMFKVSNKVLLFPAPSTTPPPSTSDVSAAIGISVACTFIVCLLLGLVVGYIFIHKYRGRIHNGSLRRYSRHRNESIMTGMTDLPTPREYSRQNSKTSTNSINHANGIKDDIPAININDVIDKPRDFDSNHSTTEAWANGKPGDKHVRNGEKRVSPLGSSASVRSWFPQTDVQYGI